MLAETEARHQKEDEGRRTDISTDDAEFPHKRRNMILAAIFAITAMLGYAFMSGLIQLHVVEYQQTQTAWSESSTKRSNKDQPSGDSAPDPLFEEQQNENQQ